MNKTVDIIDNIICSQVVMGKYRGIEVWEVLNNLFNTLVPNELLIIDIRKAKPLDYIFCQFAFGPVIKLLFESNHENKLVLFLMHEHHKLCFFRGILKHIDKNLPRNNALDAFVESGMFTMIIIGDETEIQYISQLNPIDNEILSFVNNKKTVTVRDIIKAKKELKSESIIDSLRSLNRKGFIVHITNGDDQYHSIYCYLQKP